MRNNTLMQIIGVAIAGCIVAAVVVWIATYNNKTDQNIKKEETSLTGSKLYKDKMEEMRKKQQEWRDKQLVMENDQKFLKEQIQIIETEILDLSNNVAFDDFQQTISDKKIKNRLENLTDYDNYLENNKEIIGKIEMGIDDLIKLERKFHVDYRMLSSAESINVVEFIKQVDSIIKKELPYTEKMVLNIERKKTLEQTWQRMKAKKEQRQKEIQSKLEQEEQERQVRIVQEAQEKNEEKLRLEQEEQERKARIVQEAQERKEEQIRLTKEEMFRLEQEKKDDIIAKIRSGDTSQITVLTAETADILISEFSGTDLDLDGLISLGPQVAMNLIKWQGESLSLQGLTKLGPKAATVLTEWNGKRLYLDGLTSLTPQVATSLVKWQGESLSLNGLKSITFNTAQILAKKSGGEIFLEGLTSLNPGTAQILSETKAKLFLASEIKNLVYQ